MIRNKLEIGDLVEILKGKWAGSVGIVTQPISEQKAGHLLIHKDGSIFGVDASMDEVRFAGEGSEGFAQLGYHLIKLGSLVIEKKLLLYRT